MPMNITYPLDQSGVNPANLVQQELHSVNESRFRDYFFIVPIFAPFYIDNFRARITINNVTRDLVEDVDFSFALSYVTGTRVTGKAMYGAITLHNLNLNGILSIDYQTIGGDQVADRLSVLTVLADKAYNPRTTIWDILTNVPTAFPPVPHYQDYDQFYGQEELVTALGEIRDAILQNATLTREKIAEFLNIVNSGALQSYVRTTGDTMVGKLILAGPPTEELEAVSKHYVDNNTITIDRLTSELSNYYPSINIDFLLSSKLDKTGGAVTGPLTLNGHPVEDLHAVTKGYVDTIQNNLSGDIQNLANIVNTVNTDFITKTEVEALLDELRMQINLVHIKR